MITRKDIEELRDAFSKVDQAKWSLERNTNHRERLRKELHDAHADVLQSEGRLNEAQFELIQLCDKHGVELP